MPYFDSTFLVLIPALVIAAWAQMKVSSTFQKYSRVTSRNGYTGSQVARMLLDANGLFDIPVEIIQGKLTDHYDPVHRAMRLSYDVYHGTSVASIGVAAHETGHAIQHAERYSPLMLRNSIVPVVNFSSNASWVIFILGMFFNAPVLMTFGIILFTAVVAFQLITLPVEFNASSRALNILGSRGILLGDEIKGAKAVLDAAALTYVAAVLTTVAQLVRLILLKGNRED